MSAADAEAHLARLEALVAGLERQARESDREMAARQEARADEARSGRLGPDWQAVQRRIDAGRTTLADVFGGRDDSPDAQRLAARSRETIQRLTEETPPPEEVVEELAAAEIQWETIRASAVTGQELGG